MCEEKPVEPSEQKPEPSMERPIERLAKRLGVSILPPDDPLYQSGIRIVIGPAIERVMRAKREAANEESGAPSPEDGPPS